MESLRQEACEQFLHRVESHRPVCDVLEISGSGDSIVHLETTMPLNEVQGYLRVNPGRPTFKLFRFVVAVWAENKHIPFNEFAWFPDAITELGIEPYLAGRISRFSGEFEMTERDIRGGKVTSLYLNLESSRIIASYSLETRSTTCFLFAVESSVAESEFLYLGGYLKQNERLFQNRFFLSLAIMTMVVYGGFNDMRALENHAYTEFDEDSLTEWEENRRNFRWAQHSFSLATDIASHIQTSLDAGTEEGNSVFRDVVDSSIEIREVFNILKLAITSARKYVEWRLQVNDDYMAQVTRALMRKDTLASIELTKTGIELTKAAKIDSSSMKVIAVMTMVFLPGTFFATLFSVPSLHWDSAVVMGENFWVYWAFTIPFTVLTIILWLVITQRKQMRSVLNMSMEQWSAQSARLKGRWRKSQSVKAEEEEESRNV
ncbi:hypothetical protein M434DRAFT_397074 [Hypoxylon sp. CO27-5]|nr:hypothetical protein M434DRAFT_397074 [Hypoxylon sp. CO27-5]